MREQLHNLHKRATTGSRRTAHVRQQRARAVEAGPALASFAATMFGRFGVEITDVNLKTRRRISDKARKDYNDRFDKVGDTVRLKVICDSAEQVAQVQRQIWRQKEMAMSRLGRDLERQEFPPEPVITKVKDNFTVPKVHGYRAINTKVQMPNGVTAEIQVVHRDMEAISKYTHGAYKQLSHLLREVGDNDFSPEQARQYQKLVTRLNDTYSRVASNAGLDNLMTMTARADVVERRNWLKRLVASADVRHADAVGKPVSEKLRTMAAIAAENDADQPRLRRGSSDQGPSQKALSNRIELAIDVQQRWLDDPDNVSLEERDVLTKEVIALSKRWDDMTPALRERMIEGGIAPASHSRIKKPVQDEKVTSAFGSPSYEPPKPPMS